MFLIKYGWSCEHSDNQSADIIHIIRPDHVETTELLLHSSFTQIQQSRVNVSEWKPGLLFTEAV